MHACTYYYRTDACLLPQAVVNTVPYRSRAGQRTDSDKVPQSIILQLQQLQAKLHSHGAGLHRDS